MTQWVSFDEIKSRVSIEDILDHYGVTNLKPRRDELAGRCPLPGHEDTRGSFSANIKKQAWKCFGACNKGGNLFDL